MDISLTGQPAANSISFQCVSLPIAERHRRVIADSLTDVVSRILGFSVGHSHQNRSRKSARAQLKIGAPFSFALSLPVKIRRHLDGKPIQRRPARSDVARPELEKRDAEKIGPSCRRMDTVSGEPNRAEIVLRVFALLFLDGQDLWALPCSERLALRAPLGRELIRAYSLQLLHNFEYEAAR
jgi:hypothetical protein